MTHILGLFSRTRYYHEGGDPIPPLDHVLKSHQTHGITFYRENGDMRDFFLKKWKFSEKIVFLLTSIKKNYTLNSAETTRNSFTELLKQFPTTQYDLF